MLELDEWAVVQRRAKNQVKWKWSIKDKNKRREMRGMQTRSLAQIRYQKTEIIFFQSLLATSVYKCANQYVFKFKFVKFHVRL